MTLHKRWIIRIGILGAVGLTMGWLTFGVTDVFTSPDESANAFFAQTFSQTGSLIANEPLNAIANGIIHPRSTVAPGVVILPTSFLGFPIMTGLLRFLLGTIAEFAFTPLIALIGIGALWLTIKRTTKNETLADLSAFFALIHPAFWLYSARVMMPTVTFVSLLLITVAVTAVAQKKNSTLLGLIAGLLLGLALSLRLVEAPILFLVCILVAIIYRKSLKIRPLISALLGVAIILLGYLFLNSHLYGSALTTGYTLPDTRSSSLAQLAQDGTPSIAQVQQFPSLLLPFGFHERSMLKNAFWYGWFLFPFSTTLSLIGAWFAWQSTEHRKAWRTFVIALTVASAWMVAVYGSWQIADNPDPRAITIGNSHVRYWLPLFTASSVLVGLALVRSYGLIQRRWSSKVAVLIIGIIITLITISQTLTVFTGPDGLIATRAALQTFQEKRSAILDATPSDAVIIVDRADKYLFPSRRVIVPLRSDSTYAAMPALAATVPLFYFGITLPQSDLDYLNTEKLSSSKLTIEPVITLNEETLYMIRQSN